jgi:rhodanese-related sulfurtransferase
LTIRANTALAAVALLLGTVAALVGEPSRRGDAARPLPALAEDYRVTALDVAAWLRDRRPNLTILDVRPDSTSFAEFHLPRARHAPLPELRSWNPEDGGTIVVYGAGGDLAARAWVVLMTLGHDSVRVLSDGVREWLIDVLNPTIPEDASAEAREAFAVQADLSRYFGGLPRIIAAGTEPDSSATAGLLRRTSRRGCAF